MPTFASLRARCALLAATVIALSACDDHLDPNAPSPRLASHDVQTSFDTSSALVISDLSLSSKTIAIDGPTVTYTATLFSSSGRPRNGAELGDVPTVRHRRTTRVWAADLEH